MRDVALEVPLRAFLLGGRRQRDDSAVARVQERCYPFDDAAFAGGVAPLEDRDDAQVPVPDPLLELNELDLELSQLLVVLLPRERRRSRRPLRGLRPALVGSQFLRLCRLLPQRRAGAATLAECWCISRGQPYRGPRRPGCGHGQARAAGRQASPEDRDPHMHGRANRPRFVRARSEPRSAADRTHGTAR